MTKELLAEVKQGLQRLQDELNKGHTRAFLEYLQTLGRFHQYSFHNSILIWLQKPDATLVAGFRRWQELGRWVRKGEKGIRILAPIIKKVVKEDADGLPLEVEEVVGFRTAYVFDISQTDGKPLPDRLIAQGPESLYPRLKALCPFPVEETEDLPFGTEGSTNGHRIRIRASLSPAAKAAILIHEWAHGLLHYQDPGKNLPPPVQELEAEATAYVVGTRLGLDMAGSRDYILSWTGNIALKDHNLIQRIASAVHSILHRLEAKPVQVPEAA